jgi:formylglycine-generating enzyme required for sulfatase activity
MRSLMIACIVPVALLFGGCGKDNPTGNNTPTTPEHRQGMVSITGGTFQIGSTTGNSDEQPVRAITVSAFYMDTTEVTQADYRALMAVNPSYFTGDSLRPVDQVTWFDAVLYCNARSKRDLRDTVYTFTSITGTPGDSCSDLTGLASDFSKNGYRLPTEAEWEYACKAGSTTDFYWGKNFPPTTAADTAAMDSNAVWYLNGYLCTARVGTKLPNAYGLYDMSGNVNEWCHDWYASYTNGSGSLTNPTGPDFGSSRIVRGGSWGNADIILRSSTRCAYSPDFRYYVLGFRCVSR